MKSSCCYADIRGDAGIGDFSSHDQAVTYCMVCKACEKPCDIFFIEPPKYLVGQKTIFLTEEGKTPEKYYFGVGVVMDMHGTKKDGWSYFVRDMQTVYTLGESDGVGRWVEEEDILPIEHNNHG